MKERSFIKIGKNAIGEGLPVFIIAEAGVNHNGSLKLAKKMVDAAKISGADAIKFQTFITDELVTSNAPQAEYQRKNAFAVSQYEMLKKLELSEKDFRELFDYCKKKAITFLSTPFDLKSAGFLYKLGIPAFKVSSGDLTNIPLLKQIAKYNKPVILSTGMSTLSEVNEAVKAVYQTGNKKLILLHCTSNYPAGLGEVNLRAIDYLANRFKIPVGYSDHTQGIEVAMAAVARGVSVIEKHFTLNRNLPGPDQKASLEPAEFSAMVKNIRKIEKALGDGVKRPAKSEEKIKRIARKNIVAAKDIAKGSKLTPDMIAIKRSGRRGIEPKYLGKITGKCINKPLKRDSVITWGHLI
jgi:N-acetylneuraminate synthase/N,N'-diacetyllegionaminate synthase